MKFIQFYAAGAVLVGILEIIDGALLVWNQGLINNFNLLVALAELTWFFVSSILVVMFRRHKLSLLSPASFIIYIFGGYTLSSAMDTQNMAGVPIGFAIAGAAFGLYYLFINERLRWQLGGRPQP